MGAAGATKPAENCMRLFDRYGRKGIAEDSLTEPVPRALKKPHSLALALTNRFDKSFKKNCLTFEFDVGFAHNGSN